MAITVTEAHDSGRGQAGDGAYTILTYYIQGTATTLDARAALGTESPTTYGGLVRRSYEVDPISVDSEDPDRSLWLGTVRYGPRRRSPETGESVFSFDTGGGTLHITQSIANVGRYPPDAVDHHGAIGVHGGAVEGVDITVPVYNFSETHYLDEAYVTGAYKLMLFDLTGKVNNATFKGLPAGTVLFLGASGSRRSETDWEITFRFAASPNRTNITIGNITGIRKKGWEYLWVTYKDEEDGSSAELAKNIKAVYVEQVYEYGDFSQLGIGT